MTEPLILTRDQCRAVDRYAIETLGIPGIVLMENAGRNVADFIHAHAPRRSDASPEAPRAAIIAGRGNNGGDGFVIARHLLRLGWNVEVYLAADPTGLTGDALANFRPLAKIGIPTMQLEPGDWSQHTSRWRDAAVIVDALLGTGFTGEVREPLASLVRTINGLNGPHVVAVDVPSGLDVDSGRPGGVAVEADETVTFLALKPGFQAAGAERFTGRITVADIGIPMERVLKSLGFAAQP